MNSEVQKKEEIKELVIARLEVLPSNVSISIGSDGSFTKQDLIMHVEKDDEIGKKIIEIELKYLQALKEGSFYGSPSNN